MLSKSDHTRIAQAITQAESKTSGEIFCVLTHEVSRYREVPLAWAAAAALLVPPLLALAGLHRLALADIFSSWTDESVALVQNLILRVLSGLYAGAGRGFFSPVAVVVALHAHPPGDDPAFPEAPTRRCARWRGIISPPLGAKLSHAEPPS